MLIQTQATRVAPRFQDFLVLFPTVEACAEAAPADVLRAWSGLGYNRRAVAIWTASRQIMHRYGGRVPSSFDELVALDGVGPYVARAVLAFAFDKPVAPVDTNVRRVIERAAFGGSAPKRCVQQLSDAIVPNGLARDWGLALMDFGSLVCTSRAPQCVSCPVHARSACLARCAAPARTPSRTLQTRAGDRFEGSTRQLRGRLVQAACAHPLNTDDMRRLAGPRVDDDELARVVGGLIRDRLLTESPDGHLRLISQ